MTEWRPLPGFEGYTVSSDGDIRGKRGRIIRPTPNRDGYLRVGLRAVYRGPPVMMSVHRVVLLAFVGPCPEGMQACHNNGVRSDNRVENLRWDTVRNNCLDRGKHGTVLMGERSPKSAVSDEDAANIRAAFLSGERQCDIARRFSVSPAVVHGIVRGKTRTGAPFGFGPRPPHMGGSRRKLTAEEVAQMRDARRAGESFSALAEKFGISIGTAWHVVRGHTWRHVPGPVLDTMQGVSAASLRRRKRPSPVSALDGG